MRVAVLGPGGVGGLLAARIAEAGIPLTVLGPDATIARIAAGGLTLDAPGRDRAVSRPVARAFLAEPVDILFVAVKAPDLLCALARCPPAFVADGLVVPLLNGIDHVALLRASYPDAEVLAATIRVESKRRAPGAIELVSSSAEIAIAESRRAHTVAELLIDAGFEVEVAQSEAAVLWRKLTFLAPMALLAASRGAPLGRARHEAPDVLAGLVGESVAAAAMWGVVFDAQVIERALHAAPEGLRPSLLEDLECGAPLELDAIAGPILRALAPHGGPATAAAVLGVLQHLLNRAP